MSRSFLHPWIGPWLGLLIITSTLSPASAQFVLSEFLAVNLRNLPDEEGAFEDWIEVRNTTTEVANLAGWYLTDSSRDLRKWQFPATNIQAGASIVVFASNKDRRQPGRPFHTNFRLSQSGEFLALVKPDGVTTVTSFSPTFPPQAADVSYGFGLITTNYSLAQATAPRRVLVPSAANLGSTLEDAWKGGAEPFNDSGWPAASGAAGYSGPDVSLVAVADLAFRFNFEAAPVANAILDSKPAGTPRNGNNSRAVWTANAEDRDSSPNARSGVMQFVATNASQITVAANPDINVPSGSVAFWMLSSGLTGPGTDPAAILDRRGTSGGLLLQQGTDGRLLVTARSGASTVRNSFSSGASVGDNRWHHVAVVFDQSAGGTISVYVDGQLDASGSNTGAWAWPTNTALGVGRVSDATSSIRRYNGFLDDVRFYKRVLTSAEITEVAEGDGEIAAAEIQLDLAGAMRGIQSSAFVRIPFSITDPATVDSLLIKLRYDDGYAMWINGRLVGRGNSPEVPTWDSAAVGARSAAFSETLIQTVSPGLLRSGFNILAIQAMNASAADPTFFIGAELSAFAILDEGTAPIFFTRPTPGEVNGAGVRTPGPAILETAHAPRVPQDHENLLITARVAEVFTAVSNVVLRYRINFGAEVTLPMSDEGTDGDLLPGDGIYTARIPATASTNGQMIRYAVLASDVAGNTSRWPLFHDPVGSAEYEGTVVAPESVQSQLPVFHLFASPQNLPRVDEETGGRLSVFHDGELYDNVYMELRGNTSAGLPKKSHRVEFHRNKRLRHPGPGGSVRLTSFIAEHLDPAYMRQGLSFWLLNETGTPAPFYYPVRLQMNGQFYQLASHTDVLSEDQLERMGYDPRGALYKAVGTVTPDQTSTGGFEKKTRTHESNADYQAMASAINEARSIASRRTNVFEFFDVPNLINYLVCARWVQEADDVWANMSLYVDSEGDKRWRVIPFDMNLSWGALYYGDNPSRNEGVISIDDENKSHPLYGGSQVLPVSGSLWNQLYDAVIRVPETRQMLLRRMRTVMDEWIQPPTTHPSLRKFEQRISALTNQMWADAFIDRDKWRWPSLGGPYGLGDNQWLTNATRDLVQKFIEPRRRHWYVTHAATNTARPIGVGNNRNAGIPEAQAEDVLLTFGPLDFYPSATSQAGEYLTITNPHSFAVDISGWKLRGGVSFTFGGGTVIPSNGVLYVVKSVPHFKARSAGPRGGLGLFVVGPYQGQLSSRGESLTLIDRSGRTAASIDYPGNPTEVQQQLRITEIMYQPAPPAAGSPYRASDFEYIELRNIGSAALDLDGVHFTNGLSFSFTGSAAASLAAGERTVVVKNLAAFVSRYGNSPKVAGVYEGALDNAGERITLLDRAGEVVLDFTYRRTWLPLTDGPGFSLVVRDENLPYSLWSSNGLWVTSTTDSGTPGAGDLPSPQLPAILVNEVLCSPLPTQGGEFIELHNPTGQAVDISGWYLSDDFLVPRKYRLQNGSQIPAGGYLVLTDGQFEAGAAPLPGF
ncbi:MAG: hypothetical protein FJ405_08255, partial [Verrucomicrobia bacterium]|nr:hypothetical protein [Verrucomicrobiota bacterium]